MHHEVFIIEWPDGSADVFGDYDEAMDHYSHSTRGENVAEFGRKTDLDEEDVRLYHNAYWSETARERVGI